MVSNLLSNAKKYASWWLKIKVLHDKIIFSNPSKEIKNISKLTEKFYKESDKGLWIGLFLVKKICNLLGLKLSIRYEGWCFIVEVLK